MSKSEIKQVVAQAKQVAKDAAGGGDHDPQLLAAIASVAEQVKEKAGGDPAISDLLSEVAKLTQPDTQR